MSSGPLNAVRPGMTDLEVSPIAFGTQRTIEGGA